MAKTLQQGRFADLQVPMRGQEGGALNLPGHLAQVWGQDGAGQAVNNADTFLDTASVECKGRIKTIYVVVTGAIPKTAAAQSTIQVYTGLRSFSGGRGVGTQLPVAAGNTGDQALVGAAVPLGPNAASLAIGMYVLTPIDLPVLQWELAWIGFEIAWASALNAGTGSLAVFVLLGPN